MDTMMSGSRGQKRVDVVEELPADKRACSSFEFRTGSSNPSTNTENSPATSRDSEVHESDMDASSSTSGRSEGDGEKDSLYGSWNSDGIFGADTRANMRPYQHGRPFRDHSKLNIFVSMNSNEIEPSQQLSSLTDLCETLLFFSENSLSGSIVESISQILIKFEKQTTNPDIVLLAIRAMSYLCDVSPRASVFLVRDNVIPSLCDRLLSIEYLDVAEQCLQALEKISRHQPVACLHSGAIMAALNYIDFFSTSVQRIAISIVANICKKIPHESFSLFMEAASMLCNILRYEDRQIVENSARCFIRVVDRVGCCDSDLLNSLCNHGLVHQILHLIEPNSGSSLNPIVYTGLLQLLVKFASNSVMAVKVFFEFHGSSILKDILSKCDISHVTSVGYVADENYDEVCIVLKLLNGLLPSFGSCESASLISDKRSFLTDHPDYMLQFGIDILPVLIQVVNSGSNAYICYGCLSVINKLVYFSNSNTLLEMLKICNISGFLAVVLARKDCHVLKLALEIAESVLKKLSDSYTNSFVKEGVLFSIETLLLPEKFSELTFSSKVIQLPHKLFMKEKSPCACYTFDGTQSPASEQGVCRVHEDSTYNLAKMIKDNYFNLQSHDANNGWTDILQKIQTLSFELTQTTLNSDFYVQCEKELHVELSELIQKLSIEESVSAFEFIECGIVKSLVDFLSARTHSGFLENDESLEHLKIVEKRFHYFGEALLSACSSYRNDSPVLLLVQRLQNALSTVEQFPVTVSTMFKDRIPYATVPDGRYISNPCMKIRLVREGEKTLSNPASFNVLTADPLSSLKSIERFIFSKAKSGKTTPKSSEKVSEQITQEPHRSSDSIELHREIISSQVANDEIALPSGIQVFGVEQSVFSEPSLPDVVHDGCEMENAKTTSDEVSNEFTVSSCNDDMSSALSFSIEGVQLDPEWTLYQAIIHQQSKVEHDVIMSQCIWNHVHTVIYKKSKKHEKQSSSSPPCFQSYHLFEYRSCFSDFFLSSLEKKGPVFDILFLLRSIEAINRSIKLTANSEKIKRYSGMNMIQQPEFVNYKLTEKLEQQMQDPISSSAGGMPLWCEQLMCLCPFLFGFECRCKYFRLVVYGSLKYPSVLRTGIARDRHQILNGSSRKKYLVHRDNIMDSAAQVIGLHANQKTAIEVEYAEEIGTGLGPTLEFYTLVSNEFQKHGMGLWRCDDGSNSSAISATYGLFPLPWYSILESINGVKFSEVSRMFVLLGQIVAMALQDGRVMDVHFSKAFYKLLVGKELSVHDIMTFDPELGKILLEFLTFVGRRKCSNSEMGDTTHEDDVSLTYRDVKIEDLFLDFTLPGYPYYFLSSSHEQMVHTNNLEEYVSLVVDATVNTGISRQMDSFKSGFNQVFPMKELRIFREEEVERLLCGEDEYWENRNELLDHMRFDHGYSASSRAITDLLEIIEEFGREDRRAFVQFVTGTPRLPLGGLASLSPKLTVVCKQQQCVDDLPSVMTCANYLKLPPYSTKDIMREKIVYAIREGQGAFHLS